MRFRLPLKNNLKPNGVDDPLRYYYHPVVGPLYRGRTEQFLSLLNPHYGSILEVGYGSGILMPTLATMCDKLYGLDIESDPQQVGIHLARLGVAASLISGDIQHTPYPDNHFDLIIGIGVFQYFAKAEPVLAEMHRILKPKGQLLAGIPRLDKLMHGLFHLIGFHRSSVCLQINYRQFIQAAGNQFQLVKHLPYPTIFPAGSALFHSLLFEKNN